MEARPLTSADTEVLEDDAADGANYAKAILNILDDMDTDKIRLEATQKAMLNILDDFDIERLRVEEANADLQAVNEAMKGFTAVAAHDLRSPITSIVGFATLLTESWTTLSEEDRRKVAAAIDRQAHKLSTLVDDLLTVSTIEGGALTTRPEPIGLAEAIGRYLETAGAKAASVSVSCAPDLVVRVDAQHLGRIIDNYLQNALSYGEPPVRIEATRVGDLVEVRVLDQGLGVPPQFVSRLFGKFARADTPSTRANKGTGLGLSIVRALAEANGGQTGYEANVPNGACFVLRLPAVDGSRG
jgi:signal transduction histidine kinase